MARKAKQTVTNHLSNKRLEHSLSLDTQGKLFHLVDATASAMWSKAIQLLPSAQMKFALNSATDTLPHNANLALWRKSHHLSATCKLCGEHQTLCHILNNCRTALELRRYNARHDTVLQAITKFMQQQVSEDVVIVADLDQQYLFPTSLAFTDLRPDLVAYSCLAKTAIILELTICFETNFQDAKQRKVAKYSELVEEIEDRDFVVDLITLEVGSRGFVGYDGFCQLRDSVGASQKELNDLLLAVSLAAIKGSFQIWTCRNHVNGE